jgi:hypothetical protein
LSRLFLIYFCGTLSKYHSQNHETQNANTQTARTQDISSNVVVVLSAVSWTLICVVDATANAVANVSQLFLHWFIPLSFICLYYSMEKGVCQAPFSLFS